MQVLGHESPAMSMVYARISDPKVLRDYQAVLGPGAVIAGPGADAVRGGKLSVGAVDWLKTNFLKTELELGHCLRLPTEGPCECEVFLTCSRFVTTPAYAPRLRERHTLELALVADAEARGWPREIERHRCTAAQIEKLPGLQRVHEPDQLAGQPPKAVEVEHDQHVAFSEIVEASLEAGPFGAGPAAAVIVDTLATGSVQRIELAIEHLSTLSGGHSGIADQFHYAFGFPHSRQPVSGQVIQQQITMELSWMKVAHSMRC